jgi:hypothetical protein
VVKQAGDSRFGRSPQTETLTGCPHPQPTLAITHDSLQEYKRMTVYTGGFLCQWGLRVSSAYFMSIFLC